MCQSTQERLSELRRYADTLDADSRRLSSENEARVESLTSQLMTSEKELAAVKDELRQAEKQHQLAENKWKTDSDRLQVSHVISARNRLMMRTYTDKELSLSTNPAMAAAVSPSVEWAYTLNGASLRFYGRPLSVSGRPRYILPMFYLFIYFFYGRLILRPWWTEVRESFTHGGPWVSLKKLLLGFFSGHP